MFDFINNLKFGIKNHSNDLVNTNYKYMIEHEHVINLNYKIFYILKFNNIYLFN